jgi:Pyruvate/2-oxoacid:ferredoxin oxidoreductase delta subunit
LKKVDSGQTVLSEVGYGEIFSQIFFFRRSSMDARQSFNLTKLPKIRRIILTAFALCTLYIGWRFYFFYKWTLDLGSYVPRPPAVEGFLPISALLGLKRLLLTGEFDPIHPAGLVILMAALAIAFFARKGFCGWICPVGFGSLLIQDIRARFKGLISIPRWIDYPLMSVKYLLLAFFLYMICWQMNVDAITAFIHTPYNLAADAKMLLFFLNPSSITIGVVSFLVLISLVIPHFWCRYLCPYGALLGIFAFFGPFQIHRQEDKCIDCQKCNQVCPGEIKVSLQKTVRSPECVGCLECLAVCPKEDCLSIKGPGKTKYNPWLIPALTILIWIGFWMTGLLTDHWQSKVPVTSFKQIYQQKLTGTGPR